MNMNDDETRVECGYVTLRWHCAIPIDTNKAMVQAKIGKRSTKKCMHHAASHQVGGVNTGMSFELQIWLDGFTVHWM
jgi:hypothetical protein